jgi:hypothetical protein
MRGVPLRLYDSIEIEERPKEVGDFSIIPEHFLIDKHILA